VASNTAPDDEAGTVDAEQIVTLVTFLSTMLAVVAYLRSGLTDLGGRIDRLDDKVERKIDQLDEKFDRKVDQLDEKLEQKFTHLDRKVDQLDGKLEQKFTHLDRKIDQLDGKLDTKLGRSEASVRDEMRAGFAAVDARFGVLEGRFTALETRLYDLMSQPPARPGERSTG